MAENRQGKDEGLGFVEALEGGQEREERRPQRPPGLESNPVDQGRQDRRRKAESATGKGREMHIGGRFHPEVGRQLKLIAAEEQTSVLALLCEGINHVFQSRGKPPIAGTKT